MLPRRIFVEFIKATTTGDDQAFVHILEAYQNRPFDNKKDVIAKMNANDQAAFMAHWNTQVAELKKVEDELGMTFPLNDAALQRVLPLLEAKLGELVGLLISELNDQLDEEGAFTKDNEDKLTLTKWVKTIAIAYAFHLLTAAQSSELSTLKMYAEFHRLVRKSLFKGDIYVALKDELANVFKDKSMFNQAKVTLYTSTFGDLAQELYYRGILDQLEKLTALDLVEIRKTLEYVTGLVVKKSIESVVDGIWRQRWLQYVKENTNLSNVALANNLFSLLERNDLDDTLKKEIKLELCLIARDGNFAPVDGKHHSASEVAANRAKFVGRVVSACPVTDEGNQAIIDMLKDCFKDTKITEIRSILSLDSGHAKAGIWGKKLAKSVGSKVVDAAGATLKK